MHFGRLHVQRNDIELQFILRKFNKTLPLILANDADVLPEQAPLSRQVVATLHNQRLYLGQHPLILRHHYVFAILVLILFLVLDGSEWRWASVDGHWRGLGVSLGIVMGVFSSCSGA